MENFQKVENRWLKYGVENLQEKKDYFRRKFFEDLIVKIKLKN